MSPLGRICPETSEICVRQECLARAGRSRVCKDPARVARDAAIRNGRRKQQGKTTREYTDRIRPAVLRRDGYRCTNCGSTSDLTVDFKPGGRHTTNLDDYQTLCRSCHGSKDAPRSSN